MMLPVADLERLDRLSPEVKDWTLTQVERNLEHLREIDRLGMRNAFILSLVALIGSVLAIIAGAWFHEPIASGAGGVAAVVDVGALSYIFIARKMPLRSK
jgi:hypothetical protein